MCCHACKTRALKLRRKSSQLANSAMLWRMARLDVVVFHQSVMLEGVGQVPANTPVACPDVISFRLEDSDTTLLVETFALAQPPAPLLALCLSDAAAPDAAPDAVAVTGPLNNVIAAALDGPFPVHTQQRCRAIQPEQLDAECAELRAACEALAGVLVALTDAQARAVASLVDPEPFRPAEVALPATPELAAAVQRDCGVLARETERLAALQVASEYPHPICQEYQRLQRG